MEYQLDQVVLDIQEYRELLEFKRFWWIGIFCLSLCVCLIFALCIVVA